MKGEKGNKMLQLREKEQLEKDIYKRKNKQTNLVWGSKNILIFLEWKQKLGVMNSVVFPPNSYVMC